MGTKDLKGSYLDGSMTTQTKTNKATGKKEYEKIELTMENEIKEGHDEVLKYFFLNNNFLQTNEKCKK